MAAAAPSTRPAAHDAAFERLYRRYVKDVYRYTLALLQNPAEAEDVTQTTFMNAWRAWRRGVDPQKPQNWLIKIAHNSARTRYAHQARRPQEVPLDDHLHELPVPDEDKADVAGVLRALSRLPFNQRAALVMRELEGRSYAEIAEALGVSVAAVETLIFRARRSLRVHASKLRALAAIQVPHSLQSFFENGAVVAGGGAVVGSGLIAKIVVLLAAGAVAGGVGFKEVHADSSNGHAQARGDVAAPGTVDSVESVFAAGALRAVFGPSAPSGSVVASSAMTPRGHSVAPTRRLTPHTTSGGGTAPSATGAPAPAGQAPSSGPGSTATDASPAPATGVNRAKKTVTTTVGGGVPAPPLPTPSVPAPPVPTVPAVPVPPPPPVPDVTAPTVTTPKLPKLP